MDAVVEFLAQRAVPGVEEVLPDGSYRRTVAAGLLTVGVDGTIDAPDVATRAAARRLLDLDAPTDEIDAHLRRCTVLAPLVAASPGLRLPGAIDPWELAVRAVLGQQVSVAGARTIAGRLAAEHGELVESSVERLNDAQTLTRRFPTSEAVAAIDPATLPMPRARGRALVALGAAVVGGLDLADRPALLAQKGIGPWTASYVHMRAFGDRDAWLATDLGVVKALHRLGATEREVAAWAPFRAHALMHLWRLLGT